MNEEVMAQDRQESDTGVRMRSVAVAVYLAATLLFLATVISKHRDYQDLWILSDVWVAAIVLVVAFSVLVVCLDDNRGVALASASFVIFIAAVPAGKYSNFWGVADVLSHYELTSRLVESGFVVRDTAYSDMPSLHVLVATLSMLWGRSVGTAIKYVQLPMYAVIPLITYTVVAKAVSSTQAQKFMIVASALPLVPAYQVMGRSFALVLYFVFLMLVFARARSNTVVSGAILVLLAIALNFAHAVTSLQLVATLVASAMLLSAVRLLKRDDGTAVLTSGLWRALALSATLFGGWWLYKARLIFHIFVREVSRVVLELTGRYAGAAIRPVLPERLFELPLSAQLRVFLAYHIGDALICTLTVLGVVVCWRRYRAIRAVPSFFWYLFSLWLAPAAVIAGELLSGKGVREYQTFIKYAIVFSPPFVGLALWQFSQRASRPCNSLLARRLIAAAFIAVVTCFCLLQFFPFQPLMPRATVLSPNYEPDEYVWNLQEVHSVYQTRMISFAEQRCPAGATVTADLLSALQLRAFARPFFERHYWPYAKHSPLTIDAILGDAAAGRTVPPWNMFLLHRQGRAGSSFLPIESASAARVRDAVDTLGRGAIYTNGESFIIWSP